MVVVAAVCLVACIVLELSFRISYCTDIFAAALTAHLFSSLNKAWCSELDQFMLTKITNYWEQRSKKTQATQMLE